VTRSESVRLIVGTLTFGLLIAAFNGSLCAGRGPLDGVVAIAGPIVFGCCVGRWPATLVGVIAPLALWFEDSQGSPLSGSSHSGFTSRQQRSSPPSESARTSSRDPGASGAHNT